MWIEDWALLGMIFGGGLSALGGSVLGRTPGSLRLAGAVIAIVVLAALADSAATAGLVSLFARR